MTSPIDRLRVAFAPIRSSKYFTPCAVAAASAIGFIFLRKQLIGGPCEDRVDLTGKVVIVTGASSGIGEEAACALADMNAHVIMACRDENKTGDAIERIRKRTKKGMLQFLPLDLADLASVRDFESEFAALNLPLHILILNAGVIYCPLGKTKEGFETHFGTNHLGHFLLTHLLLNKLIASKGRVVAVSSQLYASGKIQFDDLFFAKTPYSRSQAYANSKLANILFINELQRKLKGTGVDAFSVSPGLTKTEGMRHHGVIEKACLDVLMFFIGRSAYMGAQSTIKAAISPSLAGKGGAYLHNCQITPLRKNAQDPAAAAKLWEVSLNLVGLNRETLAREPSQKFLPVRPNKPII